MNTFSYSCYFNVHELLILSSIYNVSYSMYAELHRPSHHSNSQEQDTFLFYLMVKSYTYLKTGVCIGRAGVCLLFCGCDKDYDLWQWRLASGELKWVKKLQEKARNLEGVLGDVYMHNYNHTTCLCVCVWERDNHYKLFNKHYLKSLTKQFKRPYVIVHSVLGFDW